MCVCVWIYIYIQKYISPHEAGSIICCFDFFHQQVPIWAPAVWWRQSIAVTVRNSNKKKGNTLKYLCQICVQAHVYCVTFYIKSLHLYLGPWNGIIFISFFFFFFWTWVKLIKIDLKRRDYLKVALFQWLSTACDTHAYTPLYLQLTLQMLSFLLLPWQLNSSQAKSQNYHFHSLSL